jgi:hypothetical protein
MKWTVIVTKHFSAKILPNLPAQYVTIVNNASYHNRVTETVTIIGCMVFHTKNDMLKPTARKTEDT